MRKIKVIVPRNDSNVLALYKKFIIILDHLFHKPVQFGQIGKQLITISYSQDKVIKYIITINKISKNLSKKYFEKKYCINKTGNI